MNKQPATARDLVIPILIGGFSITGIVVVLLVGRALNSPAEIAATPSATPFQYIYLGTEPAITTLVVEGSELPPTDESVDGFPGLETPIILTQLIRTRTPTGTPGGQPIATRTSTASAANTYDDTDSRLTYTGSWVAQTGLSGPDAPYQGTLHISTAADNKSVTIRFSGQEFFFYYQPAPSYGTVTIYVDGDPLALDTVDQARDGGVWYYAWEDAQTHTIRIEHTGGGSVNIDEFVIPAPTSTPTKTPTQNQ